ncbi:hypothetical protein [Nocardia vulneris]|nr:hypothetical protein [Nocardia vulneris]
MPELAKRVTIDHDKSKLYIDGVEFPWQITEQGPVVAEAVPGWPLKLVTVAILAENVEIIQEAKQ